MERFEREAFGRLMIGMGELYRCQVSKMLIKIYWDVLKLFCWEDVQKAFEAHVKDPDSGQFMPKPADVVRVIRGNSQCQGLQAWTKVEKAIRLVGPYRSVVFDDPIIHSVTQDMGGWIRLCLTLQKDLPFIAKEFQTRYTSHRYQAPLCYPNYLTGLNEHQNALAGFNIDPPVLLGDEAKASLVLSHNRDTNQPKATDIPVTQIEHLVSQEGI